MCGMLAFDEVAILDKGNPSWVLFYRVWLMGPIQCCMFVFVVFNYFDFSEPILPDQLSYVLRAVLTGIAPAILFVISFKTLN